MVFVPGAGIAQVAMEFAQTDGEFCENVFYVDTGGGVAIDVSGMNEIAGDFHTWWGAGDGAGHTYKSFTHNGAILTAIAVRDMTTIDAGRVVLDVDEVGTDGGAKLPQGITFTLTARTASSGRSFRGRTYLCNLTQNFCQDSGDHIDNADPTHVTHAVAAFNGLVSAIAARGSNKLVVASRTTAGAPRAALVATPIVSYGFHDLFLDYQRRRAPGHNRHH